MSVGFFSKIRKKNPAHYSYYSGRIGRLSGATAFNNKHRIYSRYPDPRYLISPLDALPYGPMVSKGGKIVNATQKVVRKRQEALRYIKRTSQLVETTVSTKLGKKPKKVSQRRRYGVNDWY